MERNNKNLNIVILTNQPFPIGMAGTSRITSYAAGFVKMGADIKVLCLTASESAKKIDNSEVKGVYKNIRFEYAAKNTVRNDNRILAVLADQISLLKSGYIFLRDNKHKKTDAVIFYSKSLAASLFFFLITRFTGTVFLKEESEFPEAVLNEKTVFHKIYIKILTRYGDRIFDGLLVMTKTLIEYFKPRVRKRARILHVPMTVDYERFINNNDKIAETSRYIAFCGYLGWNAEGINKDGVPTLIESFKIVSEKFSDVKLYLIGFTLYQNESDRLKKLVSDLGLNDKVIFTGKIDNKFIPKYLCGASLLVLSRPNSLQAKGGFPTKLGEYLVTGNPVVVTKVGEIADYLTDGYDAYLAEPDSVNSFAEKMLEALTNTEESRRIGLRGKENALKNFNYTVQVESVIRFIQDMKMKKGKVTVDNTEFAGNKTLPL